DGPPGLTGPDPNAGPLTPWRRLVVPCRWTAEVSRPVVRFVVPLTEPDGDPGPAGAPGLLVVLDETAFAVGGLAEAIEADVRRGDAPWGGAWGSGPESAPAPTLRGRGWTQSAYPDPFTPPTPDDPPPVALSPETDGPIGHTFDTDADSPLYLASS